MAAISDMNKSATEKLYLLYFLNFSSYSWVNPDIKSGNKGNLKGQRPWRDKRKRHEGDAC